MIQELCLLIFGYLDNPSLLAMYFAFKFVKPFVEKVIKDERTADFNGKKLGIRNLKKSIISQSIQHGYQNLVTFFVRVFSRSISFKDITFCEDAARYGQLEILKDLRKNRPNIFQWDCFFVLTQAALYGHFDILKWIIEKCGGRKLLMLPQPQSSTYSKVADKQFDMGIAAARGGCIDIMNYLDTEKLASFNVYSCRNAAAIGNLKTLQWLREKGCPWDGQVTFKAAFNRHLELLVWAIKNGCPCSTRLVDNVKTHEWLNENGIFIKGVDVHF
jgi:hypothetical protein